MKKWILKAVVQKAISFLPFKHQINFLFQKYVTRGVQLSEAYFEDRLTHLAAHAGHFQRYKGEKTDIEVLELGTGWYPVVPIGFFLKGARAIHTVDISRLCDASRLRAAIDFFLAYADQGRLEAYGPFSAARLQVLQEIGKNMQGLDVDQLLEKLHIRYHIADARRLPLPDDSVDLILSNNTFEHIYPEVLAGILREFVRIVRPAGLMSHFIDMSDHFAHLDRQITIYHFLQFSPRQWRWIDNSIQPQNRWRLPQYLELYHRLDIPVTQTVDRPGDLHALGRETIHSSFRHIPPELLAISHSYLISDMGH